MLPAALGFVVFYLWPTLRTVYLSCTEYTLLAPPRWVGIDNYRQAFEDPEFWNALEVTFVYVVLTIEAGRREGVVFPAVAEAASIAKLKFAEKGVDITAFTTHVDAGTTHLHPITDHAADISAVMEPAMEKATGFDADVTSLTQADKEVSAILQDLPGHHRQSSVSPSSSMAARRSCAARMRSTSSFRPRSKR
ncbi:carbohydrate ABC transporter permease [Streptomyces sp. NPDC057877]|uniref:carbohydrate ABC transporter permease n=1 Tax=Streptomyces sp. NPDC057877 TaxID=3346269 RepID=UPI0036892BD1